MIPDAPTHAAPAVSHLQSLGVPVFFETGPAPDATVPENRHGQSVRVWARSLAGMQKEALVTSVRSRQTWRLASDEGPYLNGLDAAPCPLSLLTVGMVASYMNEIVALARQRRLDISDLELVQDNRYTMEGSALQGTMTAGALPVALAVRLKTDADDSIVEQLVTDAVTASPITGLLRHCHRSLFSLTLNGRPVPVAGVGMFETPPPRDPAALFGDLVPSGQPAEELVGRISAVEAVHGVAGGAGTSLQASQKRQLHLRGTCRLRNDGVKEVVQELFSPRGSTFRFLSDEAEEFGGRGHAPDAASYAAAGIAFCFMTQLGRYATILKKNLDQYNIVQDVHFSLGGASGATGKPGQADAVETHVHLRSSEDEDFARRTVVMGEQTCFLHALCRTPLSTHISVNGRAFRDDA